MRSRICHGFVVFALLSACETIPENLKVDVDGGSFEIKRKPPAAEPAREESR